MSTDRIPDKIPDSITDMQARGRRLRAESAHLEAERLAQEQHQRARQARHRERAMLIDAEMQELIGRRILRAQEEARLQSQAEVAPVSRVYSERQDKELELEQAAGRRALAKYAQRNENARVSAEEKAKDDPNDVPGFQRSR